MEVFDDVTQKWYRVAPLNHARSGLQERYKMSRTYVQVDSFCTNSRQLKKIQNCQNFFAAQLAAVRGKIYAIGGWDDNHEYLDTVEEYDTIR